MDLAGKSFGRYQIQEPLGQGGMATVYKALDTHLDRIVAVKILPEQLQHTSVSVARFRREARAMAQLTHPGIVKILDYGNQDGILYLVMEIMPGGTLKQKLGQQMTPKQAAQLLLPIARALSYAHTHGIIHRDIKPSNILLNDSDEPMLSDFGIAKMVQGETTTNLTWTGAGIGTPEYMAPEQGMDKEVDNRADIYSLGIVFYEMVTGVKPYTADTPLTVLMKHASEPLPSPRIYAPSLSMDVERFLYKILEKNPQDRYPDMAAVVKCLEKIAQGKRLTADEAPPTEQPVISGKKYPSWLPVALAVFGTVLLTTALFIILQSVLASQKDTRVAFVTGVTGVVRSQSGAGSIQFVKKGMMYPLAERVTFTSGDGQVRLDISDGSTVCIAPQTVIDFVPDKKDNAALFRVNLQAGSVLVLSEAQDISFKILKPYPVAIQGKGIIFGMEYFPMNGAEQQLELNCLDGNCLLQSTIGSLILPNGGHTQFSGSAAFRQPDNPNNSYWNAICEGLTNQHLVNVPFPPTQRATLTATATLTSAPATLTPRLTSTPTTSSTPTLTTSPSPSFTPTRTKTRVIVYPTSTPKPQKEDNHPAGPPTQPPP